MAYTRLFAVLLAALSSCITSLPTRMSDSGVIVAESDDADGGRVRWEAFPGTTGRPRLDRTESVRTQEPEVGISAITVTRELANAQRVEPWVGAYLDRVVRSSPADDAGLRTGDIVLRVDDVELNSGGQLVDWVRTHAVSGQPFDVEFLATSSERPGPPVLRKTQLIPVAREVRQSFTESFELTSSSGVQQYTGLQVAELSPPLASDVYGAERGVVLVTGTVVGSPAYEAGLRRGDRVLTCDGEPVDSLRVIRSAVRGRLGSIGADGWPNGDGLLESPAAARDGDIQLTVDGPLGPHATSLALTDDLADRTRLHIPILLDHSSNISRTRTSFLDFIFQFGFNYRSREHSSSTREPVRSWEFSLLPFGMFEFEKDVNGDRRNRFFWFISYES